MMDSVVVHTDDGKDITIREMDDSYTFAGDMKLNPHTGQPGCCTADCVIDPETASPNEVFEKFHREVKRRYGQSAILAWHDGKVAGFINFHPLKAGFDTLCPQCDTRENRKAFKEFRWPDDPGDTLRILCVSLGPGYRRKGLGTKLVETLIEWTPSWGFSKLHVGANEGLSEKGWWTPCKPFWDRLGFEVCEIVELPDGRPDGEKRIFIMERVV